MDVTESGLCPDGMPPRVMVLGGDQGIKLTLMDWGATWLSCTVPVGESKREVLLGCGRIEAYFVQKAFMGATVGRYANRIGRARYRDGHRWVQLVPNEAHNQLHGGPEGFSRRRWAVIEISASHAVLGIESPEGDQGFPGRLRASVCFRLDGGSAISIGYEASVEGAASPVNLTNHAYFNLDGTATDVRRHALRIAARHYLPVDETLIPVGPLAPVAGTSFDFTRAKPIERDFLADEQQRLAGGYDHAFLLDPECRSLSLAAASLVSGDGRLAMDVYTSKPAVQFYSGNHLGGLPNREGGRYAANQGLALETQFLPDSPNHPEWPQESCFLHPGERYSHRTVLAFRRP